MIVSGPACLLFNTGQIRRHILSEVLDSLLGLELREGHIVITSFEHRASEQQA
jgi:hypothetical protein